MTTPADLEIAVKPAEAARRLGVSRETIYREIRQGKLKAYKPSERLTLIKIDDLREWMQARSNGD